LAGSPTNYTNIHAWALGELTIKLALQLWRLVARDLRSPNWDSKLWASGDRQLPI